MSDRNAERTRARILEIAAELFRTQGYAGTSIAHIATRLGTSKSALYFHFPSKQDILDALIAEPLSAHARIADLAATGQATPEELLGAIIDMVAGAGQVMTVFGNDPSVLAALAAPERDYRLREKDDQITAALAGPQPDAAALVRAHAATTIAKDGTKAVMAGGDGHLSAADRAELLAAAVRALHPRALPTG